MCHKWAGSVLIVPSNNCKMKRQLHVHQVSVPNFSNLFPYVLEVDVRQTIGECNVHNDDQDQLEQCNHATLAAQ